MKILLVDSCEQNRSRSSEALRELTNVAIHGSVGSVAGAMQELDGAEVVVTDAELTDGDYQDVIGAARQRTPTPAIVVFSRAEAPDLGRRTIAAGADFYLPQSAGLLELQRAVLDMTPRLRRRRDSSGDRYALLGRVTAGVAHDLANYLNAIDGSIALAQRKGMSTPDLDRARRATEAATTLLGTLLEHARGGGPAPGWLDLRDVVQRTLDLFGRALPDGVLVVVDFPGELPPIRGVGSELEQLVLNLVLDACDAMPTGGELRIALGRGDRDQVELFVSHDGIGAAERAVTVGLGIVRAVADRHGAALRIVHRAGGGSRAIVSFSPPALG
jgi:signal transduction histidine kinase